MCELPIRINEDGRLSLKGAIDTSMVWRIVVPSSDKSTRHEVTPEEMRV